MGVVKCPKCGLRVSDYSGECFACGSILPKTSESFEISDAETPQLIQIHEQNNYNNESEFKSDTTISTNKTNVETILENGSTVSTQKAEKNNAKAHKRKHMSFSELIDNIEKHKKLIIGCAVAVLLLFYFIWYFGVQKPHKEAISQFESDSMAYTSNYYSYNDAVDKYNNKISTLKQEKEEAASVLSSLKELLNNPEIEDNSLLDEMQNVLANSESIMTEEINAQPITKSVDLKMYTADGLKTKEIRALTDEINRESAVITEELKKVNELSEEIPDISYTNIISTVKTLETKYDEAVKKAKGMINAPTGEMKGKNYSDVVKVFEDQGFTNVKVEGLGDLILAVLYSEGETEEVSIGGITDYKPEEYYDSKSEVVVRYHSRNKVGPVPFGEETTTEENTESEPATENATESEAESEETSDSSQEVKSEVEQKILDETNKPLPDLVKYLKNKGYKATYIAENTGDDFTEWIGDEPEVAENFLVYGYNNYDEQNKTVTVYIEGTTIAEEKKNASTDSSANSSSTDSTTLDSIDAWQYAEQYGEYLYPYGFQLHYYMEKYAEKQESDGSWFLKAGCTVKNAFGAKAKLICEARVSGTNENPKIESFNVY